MRTARSTIALAFAAGLVACGSAQASEVGATDDTHVHEDGTMHDHSGDDHERDVPLKSAVLAGSEGSVTYEWAFNPGPSNLAGEHYRINIGYGGVVLPVVARSDCINGTVMYQPVDDGVVAIALLPAGADGVRFVAADGHARDVPALGVGEVPIPIAVATLDQKPASDSVLGNPQSPGDDCGTGA